MLRERLYLTRAIEHLVLRVSDSELRLSLTFTTELLARVNFVASF